MFAKVASTLLCAALLSMAAPSSGWSAPPPEAGVTSMLSAGPCNPSVRRCVR